jgi:CheY-like chemotaxis protein
VTIVVAASDMRQSEATVWGISIASEDASTCALPDQPLPRPESRTRSTGTGEERQQSKIFALLVEDNRADVLIIEEAILLYDLPLQLHVVEDGDQAFQFIDRADHDPEAPCPQVLLLDLNLPKRSGKEVIQRVRQSARCKGVPILVISSSNSPKDRNEVVQLGAQHYFCKPVNYDEFLKVGAILQRMLSEQGI